MNTTQQIIDDMRKITMLTGQISTIHKVSLEKWCYIAFDYVEEVEIKYDLSKDRFLQAKMGFVDFYIKTKNTKEPGFQQQHITQRIDTLSGWVRDIFWKEIAVSVYIDNQLVGQSIPETSTGVDLKGDTDGSYFDKK